MNINHDNFETFFLLYVDKELSAQEMAAVELFVQQNPGMATELDNLQQTVTSHDSFIFKPKNKLLKPIPASTEISEQLLLYIDNELPEPIAVKLANTMLADEAIAAEFHLLQQTKLVADENILFKYKARLYKKDHKIISLWWRMAAAVFIGLILLGIALKLQQPNRAILPEAALINKLKPNIPIASTSHPLTAKEFTIPQPVSAVAVTKIEKQPVTQLAKKRNTVPALKQQLIRPIALLKQNNLIAQQKIKEENNLPAPISGKTNSGTNKPNPNTNQPDYAQFDHANTIVPTAKQSDDAINHNSSFTAAFTNNLDENTQGQFSFSEDEPKKSRLRGLLRKAKRILEQATQIKPAMEGDIRVANITFSMQ